MLVRWPNLRRRRENHAADVTNPSGDLGIVLLEVTVTPLATHIVYRGTADHTREEMDKDSLERGFSMTPCRKDGFAEKLAGQMNSIRCA